MLATHEPHPVNAIGLRRPHFVMENGMTFVIELLGLRWEPYPSLDPWTLRGKLGGSLPKGYSAHEPGSEYSDIIEFKYDPTRREGSVDLYIVSPCHWATIYFTLADGVLVGHCNKCHESVIRRSNRTGRDEWLDGQSPWATEGDFREVDSIVPNALAH